MNINRENALKDWGVQGYMECWSGYDRDYRPDIFSFIKSQLGDSKKKHTLEIGSGGGCFTEYLVQNSASVTCLEVIDKPPQINPSVKWILRSDNQFNCQGIGDKSIDFVFCFGVFCHFNLKQCEEYLRDIKRVLKNDGSAILMYSDAKKHPNVFDDYNDYELTIQMVERCGLNYTKLIDFRDTLLLITK